MPDPKLTELTDRELENQTVDTANFPYQKMRGNLYWDGSAWQKWTGSISATDLDIRDLAFATDKVTISGVDDQGDTITSTNKPVLIGGRTDVTNTTSEGSVVSPGVLGIDADSRPAVGSGHLLTRASHYLFNGSTWDRARGDTTNGLDVDVTRLPSSTVAGSSSLPAGTNAIGKLAANSGVDIGDVDVTSIAAGTNAIGNVGMTPRTSGGLLIKNCTAGDGSTALTNSAQAIKASAGQLFGWYIFNPNTVTVWINFYNTAAASVTVGTTNPVMVFGVPAGSAANVLNPMGIEFTNAGWSVSAVMTTAGGNTAPTTAVDANFFYI